MPQKVVIQFPFMDFSLVLVAVIIFLVVTKGFS